MLWTALALRRRACNGLRNIVSITLDRVRLAVCGIDVGQLHCARSIRDAVLAQSKHYPGKCRHERRKRRP